MPRPHPPEFRRRAVELARLREKPVAQIAEDLGISDSCLRGWMKQSDIDEGRRADGLTTAERAELVKLRRELRVANRGDVYFVFTVTVDPAVEMETPPVSGFTNVDGERQDSGP